MMLSDEHYFSVQAAIDDLQAAVLASPDRRAAARSAISMLADHLAVEVIVVPSQDRVPTAPEVEAVGQVLIDLATRGLAPDDEDSERVHLALMEIRDEVEIRLMAHEDAEWLPT